MAKIPGGHSHVDPFGLDLQSGGNRLEINCDWNVAGGRGNARDSPNSGIGRHNSW
jgi:hypothetical protein